MSETGDRVFLSLFEAEDHNRLYRAKQNQQCRTSCLAPGAARLGDSGLGIQGNTEAAVAVADRRDEPVPVRRPTNRGQADPPAATLHAGRSLFGASRIADGTLGVLTVPVATPFPDITVHVE